MAKGYRPYLPEQDLLLPPNLRDWLPENHLVYFVSDVVDQLDLSKIHAAYGEERRGQPPYDPCLMTKLLVYGYCIGVFSSRRIHKRLREDIPFKVLAAGNEPDFRTISDFRKNHLEALQGLFEQVLEMALESGAMKLGRVSLDGTKVKANASKHKAMSYGRMKEKQQQLKEEVQQLLARAEAADAEEDERHGRDRRGDELPAELQRRESRMAKIKQAKKALEQRAREKAAAEGKSAEEANKAKPADKDQYNFTDPESRIMMGPDGIVQGFNAQAAVEPTMQLIVGQRVTQAANDKEQLQPMVETIQQQAGQRPEAILADNGYCSDKNLEFLESDQSEQKIEGYLATGKQKHGEPRTPCKPGPLPKGATRMDRMNRKLQTKVGKAVYAARKSVVEPVFGQIKQARGFRQFLLRGLKKIAGEWALVCMTHNLLRIYAVLQA
jgi:transposase